MREGMGLRSLLLATRVLTFATSPARSPDAELLPLTIAPTLPTLGTPTLKAWSCVDRGEVHAVRACTLAQLATADGDGNFVAPPRISDPTDGAPDAAAEASAFFHAARARSFFEGLAGQSLPNGVDVVAGLRIPLSLREGDLAKAALPATVLDPFAVSFYLHAGELPAFDQIYGTTRGTVWLGRGASRDNAYDGTIVQHEMTHAMLDGLLPARGFRFGPYGASAEPEAMSEALADYFSAAMGNDPRIGEWVSGEPGLSLAYRDLSALVACPAILDGRAHDESLLLSGSLWSARSALDEASRDAFDGAVYHAVARTPARVDIGFSDLVASIAPVAFADAVRTELARRNVGCAPIVDPGAALRATRGTFYAPGTDVFAAAVGGTPSVAPGIVQLRVDVPSGTKRIVVELQASSGGGQLFAPVRTPFAPSVLASWDAPLQWTGATPSANVEGVASSDAIARAALDVPVGVKVAYLQIVNRGQSDGTYDYVTVTMTSEVPSPPSPGVNEAPFEASGSGCAMKGGRPGEEGSGALLVASVLAALTARGSRGGTGGRRSCRGWSWPSSR